MILEGVLELARGRSQVLLPKPLRCKRERLEKPSGLVTKNYDYRYGTGYGHGHGSRFLSTQSTLDDIFQLSEDSTMLVRSQYVRVLLSIRKRTVSCTDSDTEYTARDSKSSLIFSSRRSRW